MIETKKWRNIKTGEIVTQVNIFELGQFEEVPTKIAHTDKNDAPGQISNYADKIHITKKKMVDIYYKVICDRNQYAIEQDPVGVKRRIRALARDTINKHHKWAYGYIIDPTGDIMINLHKCKIHAKHGDPIGQVIETLNHEIMHSILLNEHGQNANKQWDNIADEIGDQGFLGGFPGEEQTKTTESDIKMDEHNTLED